MRNRQEQEEKQAKHDASQALLEQINKAADFKKQLITQLDFLASILTVKPTAKEDVKLWEELKTHLAGLRSAVDTHIPLGGGTNTLELYRLGSYVHKTKDEKGDVTSDNFDLTFKSWNDKTAKLGVSVQAFVHQSITKIMKGDATLADSVEVGLQKSTVIIGEEQVWSDQKAQQLKTVLSEELRETLRAKLAPQHHQSKEPEKLGKPEESKPPKPEESKPQKPKESKPQKPKESKPLGTMAKIRAKLGIKKGKEEKPNKKEKAQKQKAKASEPSPSAHKQERHEEVPAAPAPRKGR